MTVCPYCGETQRVEVFEFWTDGAFLLDACCEAQQEIATLELNEDPKAAAAWLAAQADVDGVGLEDLAGDRLRRVVDVDGQLRLDWNLEVRPIAWKAARAFVAQHHRHCKPPAGWRFGAGVWNGAQLVGVVIVGRPVARLIDASQVVEVNRLCVRPDVPAPFVWNACSMLYGHAAREAKRRGFARIITYTLEDEPATTLRAAGWTLDGTTRGGSWNRRSRARRDCAPTVRKKRWFRDLRPVENARMVSSVRRTHPAAGPTGETPQCHSAESANKTTNRPAIAK